ncbi:hypothetical protein BOTBODRAFT_204996 [Botryobasidium botryosum FD-172 SS1]|uniref:Uncharacterized protein n=1 Tax=Botryobasidium botryosum (strain FD-172 SS1) TaxID=930990 RepID=A0A067N0W1_BOTB1|nr:hypothetical protein BOTBODRAFT_204996 [Botryobasidium botryosum FD-172 SS1]
MFWEHHWEEYVTWLTGYMDYVEGVCKCLAAYEEQTLAYDSCDAFGPLLDAVRGKAAKAFGWDSGWDEEMKSVGSDRQVAYITTALTGLLDMSPHCDSTLRSYLDPLLIAQALATPSHSYTQLPPPFDNGTIQDYVAHLLNAGITLSKLSLPLDKGEGLPTWTLPGTALSGLFGALVAALVSTTVILFISLLWGLL